MSERVAADEATLSLVLPLALRAALARSAETHDRTLSSEARVAVREYLERNAGQNAPASRDAR